MIEDWDVVFRLELYLGQGQEFIGMVQARVQSCATHCVHKSPYKDSIQKKKWLMISLFMGETNNSTWEDFTKGARGL